MSIQVQCPQCGKQFKVDDTWAGKRARCKACGGVLAVPVPVMPTSVQPMPVLPMDQLPWPSEAISLPPAYSDFAPVNPYVTLQGEEAIDRWLPWVSVAVFLLAVVINTVVAISAATAGTSINTTAGMAAAIGTGIGVLIAIVFSIAVPAASGALLLLGVYIGSQIMNFPNQRLLYWRCIAAACAAVGIDYTLKNIGLDFDLARWFLSVAVGLGVLWLLLRLRLQQFAVAGGFAAMLGFVIPLGLIFGIKAALAPLVNRSAGSTPMAMTPLPTPRPTPVYSPAYVPASPVPGFTQVFNIPATPQVPTMPSFQRPAMPNMPTFPQPPMPNFQPPQMPQMPAVPTSPFNRQTAQMPSAPGRATMRGSGNLPQGTTPVQTDADAGPVMQRIGQAYQQYFKTHARQYPHGIPDLVKAGDLKAEDGEPFTGWTLSWTSNLPPKQSLPASLIVAYMHSSDRSPYTVLFGDWHVGTVAWTDWAGARAASTEARRAVLQQSP